MILYGLETEYGITREAPEENYDVVAESIALVRAATQAGVHMRWDYGCEDPHVDARGFRVDALLQDTDEANYVAQDKARAMSFSEIKSDLVLKNGARFYNDHAHPEYCTPECRQISDLVRQDQLGDQLVMRCAQALSGANADSAEGRVRLYKNNTDFRGHSYGCHENYLIPRALSWNSVSHGMRAFLATRQLFCGAGKFGWEVEDRYVGPGFQISQRADFFSVLESVDTMQQRPLVNTRDEPHADPKAWRRFHVITGDANLSPYATYLKVGSAAAVLNMLGELDPKRVPQLKDPVGTMRALSRDPSWKWTCKLSNGTSTTAIEVQRQYLELVREVLPRPADGFQLEDWERILDDLESAPEDTADRLDWMAKFQLISQFRQTEGLSEDDPWLMSLDLSYHLLDDDEGLFCGLRDQGHFTQPPGVAASLGSALLPPSDTRACIRGLCVQRFGQEVISAQWDHVRLRNGQGMLELDLRKLFDERAIVHAVKVLEQARSVSELSSLPFAKALKTV